VGGSGSVGSGGWAAVGGSGPLGSSSVSLAGGDGRPEKRDSAGEEGRPTGEEREALGGKMKKICLPTRFRLKKNKNKSHVGWVGSQCTR
jgi:hypothetical protein